MLRELRVRDLALLESAGVEFRPGLNVVTGATGAGKSLLLAALGLLLGGRWSREMMRTGADRMEVEGLFEIADVAAAAAVRELLDDDDCPEEPPLEVVVRRRVDASGRNRCEVQGRLVPVRRLAELGRLLAEVHGQSEHQGLLEPARQTGLLDRAGGLAESGADFAERLAGWRGARERLAELREREEQRARRVADLEAVGEEIRALGLQPGECDALRRERDLLASAERHAAALDEALALASDGLAPDDEPAADRIGRAARALEEVAELSDEARDAQTALDTALDAVAEAAGRLRAALSRLEADPQRLEEIEDRLADVGVVLRRHGPTEEEALRRADEADREAAELRAEVEEGARLAERVAGLAAEALASGVRLDAERAEAGTRFAASVRAALAELNMPDTRFEIVVPDRGDDALARATRQGLGPVEFLVSPNPGEALRPLARVASGGELARIALAIKGELAHGDDVPLLVFDEIDADVGPRLGDVIGRRLASLAAGRQVLVVTHLPQVAAHADWHLRATKAVEDGRTSVEIEPLDGADRELEIAEMMRGAGRGTEAVGQARAMLADARGRADAE